MTTATVLLADTPIGSAITVTLAARRLDTTAVVRFVATSFEQPPGTHIRVVSGDLFDAGAPERFFSDADVVVIPFGTFDRTGIDIAGDLEIARVVCRVGEGAPLAAGRLVLVGRAPSVRGTDPGANVGHLGTHIGTELATLGVYAARARVPWRYTTPYGPAHGESRHTFITKVQSASPVSPTTVNLSSYLAAVADAIEGRVQFGGGDLGCSDVNRAIA